MTKTKVTRPSNLKYLGFGFWKDKNAITFVCYISGSDKDNLTVHWISGNNVDIWKSEADLMYNTYDENGNKLQ